MSHTDFQRPLAWFTGRVLTFSVSFLGGVFFPGCLLSDPAACSCCRPACMFMRIPSPGTPRPDTSRGEEKKKIAQHQQPGPAYQVKPVGKNSQQKKKDMTPFPKSIFSLHFPVECKYSQKTFLCLVRGRHFDSVWLQKYYKKNNTRTQKKEDYLKRI